MAQPDWERKCPRGHTRLVWRQSIGQWRCRSCDCYYDVEEIVNRGKTA